MFSKISFQKRTDLGFAEGFLYFIFWKKNLRTLLVLYGKGMEIAHQAKLVSLERPEKPLRDVMTSSGRPHVVLNVTLREVYAAGRPWDVLRTSINYVFMRFFIFLIPFLFQTFYCKSKLKT